MTFQLLKSLHMSLAAASVIGFVVRGLWMIRDSPNLGRPWVRVAPHVLDTLLLFSGVDLAVAWQVSPLTHPWFAAKLVAIFMYIVAGSVALKPGRRRAVRVTGFVVALLAAGYVVLAATTKSPVPGW